MATSGDPDPAGYKQMQLAHEPAFQLGTLTVRPMTRQVSRGTEVETLEPRVMQVLVALKKAPDHVLTRDELIECCWGGRIVSEDAINRVLSRLRHVASGIGNGSFAIETIRGVGYRLLEEGRAASAQQAAVTDPPRFTRNLSRRTLLGGTVAAAAVAGAGAWRLTRPEPEPLPLALEYYRRGMATRGQGSLQLAEQGTAVFREAARIDPEFADAWGALAWNYRGLMEFGPAAGHGAAALAFPIGGRPRAAARRGQCSGSRGAAAA